MSLLDIENLTAGYGEINVLHGVSLHVDPGEIVGILGRNGAGKSTLIQSIMRQTRIKSGAIRVADGIDLTQQQSHEVSLHGICVVPQGNRVFPKLTVQENLRLASRNAISPEQIKGVLSAHFPQLLNKRIQSAGSLSGGEQQMLALARLYLADPQLALLDEPTEGLMPSLVQAVEAKITALRDDNVGVLIAEQNLEFILRTCSRYYVLKLGRIIDEGVIEPDSQAKLESLLGIGL